MKYTFRHKHLKGVHKITEPEYVELFGGEMEKGSQPLEQPEVNNEDTYPSEDQQMDYPDTSQMRYENTPAPPSTDYRVEEAPQVLPKPSKSDIQDKTNTICF